MHLGRSVFICHKSHWRLVYAWSSWNHSLADPRFQPWGGGQISHRGVLVWKENDLHFYHGGAEFSASSATDELTTPFYWSSHNQRFRVKILCAWQKYRCKQFFVVNLLQVRWKIAACTNLDLRLRKTAPHEKLLAEKCLLHRHFDLS